MIGDKHCPSREAAVRFADAIVVEPYMQCLQSAAMSRRFESILSTTLTISTAFGAFPMKKSQNMTYRFSWTLYTYSISLGLIACLAGSYWAYLAFAEDLPTASALDGIIIWFNTCTWIIVLFQYYLKKDKVGETLSQLYEIHCRIDNTVYGSRYVTCLIIITVLHSIPNIVVLIHHEYSFFDVIKLIVYFIFINISVIVAGQYSVTMNLLSDQLVSITQQLRMSKYKQEIRHAVAIQHAICTLAFRFNKAFDVLLLQTITLPFVMAIVNIYTVILCIAKPDSYDQDDELFTSVMDVIVNASIIVIIVASATGATNSAKGFTLQLYNNMLMCKTLGKDNYLKTSVSMNCSVEQTACGFFTLDYSIITSMIAATATYVILLVQFTLL